MGARAARAILRRLRCAPAGGSSLPVPGTGAASHRALLPGRARAPTAHRLHAARRQPTTQYASRLQKRVGDLGDVAEMIHADMLVGYAPADRLFGPRDQPQ